MGRELIVEYKQARDTGDAWGSCMRALFDVAGEFYARGEEVPAEWNYSSGAAAGDPRNEDSPLFEILADAHFDDLQHFGKVLWRYRHLLIVAGRDY